MTQGEPKRAVVLMIETTGMAPLRGDRVVEIGGVEIIGRHLTLRRFHSYLNCGRESDSESFALHRLTTEFLKDKPSFPEIAGAFSEFLQGAELIAQPRDWTIEFLDREWSLASMPPTATRIAGVQDIQELAKLRAHGDNANLNTLCSRYGIRKPKSMHGTLLDAWMLAKVYIALTRNRASLASHEM